jgi:hypothetical protein
VITETNAVDIARARAAEKGWGFADPVQVVVRRRWSGPIFRYEIETNAGKLGAKARFVVDAETGAIVSEGYVPR